MVVSCSNASGLAKCVFLALCVLGAAACMAASAGVGARVGAGGLPGAASPPVSDTMAQRVLACTGCHGPQGKSSPEGYVPRIAGKPAGYLHQQLLAFRDGRRRHDGMARLLQHLGDDYLAEIAAHFAALDVPYAVAATNRAAVSVTTLQRGEQLALRGDVALQLPACVACHGRALTGVVPAVPGLLGLPKDYVLGQLGGWRVGARQARKPDCMALIAQRLAPADVAAVAEWLQAQPIPTAAAPVPQAPATWPMECGSVRP